MMKRIINIKIILYILLIAVGVVIGFFLWGFKPNQATISLTFRPDPPIDVPREISIQIQDSKGHSRQYEYQVLNTSSPSVYFFNDLKTDETYTVTGRICHKEESGTINCTTFVNVEYCSGLANTTTGECRISGSGTVSYAVTASMK